MITRFMQVMFSAAENNDEELTKQVADDIEATKAQEEGSGFEDDEVSYVNLGSGKVLITDKGTGEATVAEQNEEDPEQYDLEGFENDEELEKYLHTLDGITPDENVQTEVTENFEDHMTGEDVISPNLEDGGLNPEAGYEPTVEEHAEGVCPECGEDPCECEDEEEDEEEEYPNTASEKIFSDSEFYCCIFSEVLDEEKPAIIGDLKIEKTDEDTIIVTDIESGDEAQVTVNDEDEFVVNDVQRELSEEKTYSVTMTEEELAAFSELCRSYSVTMTEDELVAFSEWCNTYSDLTEEEDEEGSEQFEPVFVVGIDPVNHVIVDSPVYDEEDAQLLAQRLGEDGVEGIQIFDDPDEAREYAISLLGEAGVSEIEQIAEPQEHAFSDVTIYTTRYFSDCTEFMFKLFSEADEEITDTQDEIEEAIESGEQKENDSEIITPIDDETAIVHDKDNDEYTKVVLDGEDINTQKISEEEADELTKDLDYEKDPEENEEESKEFSTLDKFFTDVVAAEPAVAPAPVQAVDPSQINPETGDPVNVEPVAAPAQSVELVEDKALAAVQSIQEAANEAVLAITEAKEAPAPGEEADLKEAQFSTTSKSGNNDTLADWFESI